MRGVGKAAQHDKARQKDMERLRPAAVLVVLAVSAAGAQDRLSDADAALAISVAKQAAFAEASSWSVLHPPTGSGGQRGLFWSNRLQNQLNPLGGMDLRAVREYMVLFPGGQAYNDLPNDGHVLDIDIASACARTPLRRGAYQVSRRPLPEARLCLRHVQQQRCQRNRERPWPPTTTHTFAKARDNASARHGWCDRQPGSAFQMDRCAMCRAVEGCVGPTSAASIVAASILATGACFAMEALA